MNRITYLLSLVALIFGISAGATAANTLTLTDAQAHPGEAMTVTASLSNSDAVTGVELTMALPEWLTYEAGSATLAGRTVDHMVHGGVKDGVLRIYVVSPTSTPLPGNDGALLSFRLKAGKQPATYRPAAGCKLSDAAGEAIPAEAVAAPALTILSPAIEILTKAVDYGHIPIRSVYTRTVTIRNSGNEPLTINAIESPVAELRAEGFGDAAKAPVIAAGESRSFTLTYAPVLHGAITAVLTVRSNAINYFKQEIQVAADPFSVNELHVGNASGASDGQAVVTMRMNNMEPITAVQCRFKLPEALAYAPGTVALTDRAADHTASATVDADGRLTVLIYSPTSKPLTGDDGNLFTLTFNLQGRSGTYYLYPEDVRLANTDGTDFTSAVSSGYVRIDSPTISGAESLSFGEQPVTSPITAAYTVRNSGRVALTVDKVTFLAEGYTVVTPLPLVVEPYASAPLELSYTTTNPGAFASTMNIYSNDPELRLKTVALSGTGFMINELGLTGDYSDSGDEASVDVRMRNESPIAAVQFVVETDTPAAVTGAPVITPTERLTGLNTAITALGEGKWRVIAYSLSNTPIADADGVLMTLTFPVAGDAAPVTFTVRNVVVSSPQGENMLSLATQLPQSVTVSPMTWHTSFAAMTADANLGKRAGFSATAKVIGRHGKEIWMRDADGTWLYARGDSIPAYVKEWHSVTNFTARVLDNTPGRMLRIITAPGQEDVTYVGEEDIPVVTAIEPTDLYRLIQVRGNVSFTADGGTVTVGQQTIPLDNTLAPRGTGTEPTKTSTSFWEAGQPWPAGLSKEAHVSGYVMPTASGLCLKVSAASDEIITAVETVEQSEVISVSYYNLQGMRLTHPASGTIVIVRTIRADGTSTTARTLIP